VRCAARSQGATGRRPPCRLAVPCGRTHSDTSAPVAGCKRNCALVARREDACTDSASIDVHGSRIISPYEHLIGPEPKHQPKTHKPLILGLHGKRSTDDPR
jgi:hypothetical protein